MFSYPSVIQSLKQRDVVHHIHWINNDTLSIFDLHKIPAGSIFTLHDEWLYCATEHCYPVNTSSNFFCKGYPWFSKNYLGFPWHPLIWRIKMKQLAHRSDFIITVPSKWMLERARCSQMLRNMDIRLLPNPIDTEVFLPSDPAICEQFRRNYHIKSYDFVFCFNAIGGKKNTLKGIDLLAKAFLNLNKFLLPNFRKRIKLITFGGSLPEHDKLFGFDIYNLGYIYDPAKLALIYSSADCVVVPSMIESFGQVAAESISCETPVIAFSCSGLLDIISDKETGLLVEPYSVLDLTKKLRDMILMDSKKRLILGKKGRQYVQNNFSYPVIAKADKKIIDDALLLRKF